MATATPTSTYRVARDLAAVGQPALERVLKRGAGDTVLLGHAAPGACPSASARQTIRSKRGSASQKAWCASRVSSSDRSIASGAGSSRSTTAGVQGVVEMVASSLVGGTVP